MSDQSSSSVGKPPRTSSRRRLLKAAAAIAGSSVGTGVVTGFPSIWAQNIKGVVLRHNGTPVTAIPAIAEQANKDLGFTVQMQASEGNDLLNRLLSTPTAIDCADISITFVKYLAGRNVLRDSDMQAAGLGEPLDPGLDYAGLKRGDLVFWKGHVAIMTDINDMIHANGHTMLVSREGLKDAVDRIGYLYGGPTGFRRP